MHCTATTRVNSSCTHTNNCSTST